MPVLVCVFWWWDRVVTILYNLIAEHRFASASPLPPQHELLFLLLLRPLQHFRAIIVIDVKDLLDVITSLSLSTNRKGIVQNLKHLFWSFLRLFVPILSLLCPFPRRLLQQASFDGENNNKSNLKQFHLIWCRVVSGKSLSSRWHEARTVKRIPSEVRSRVIWLDRLNS